MEQLRDFCLLAPFITHLYFQCLHPRLWCLQDLVVPLGLGQLQCGLPELLSAEISSFHKQLGARGGLGSCGALLLI